MQAASGSCDAWLGKIRVRFGAPLSQQADQEVLSCRDDLEAFAESVYEFANHVSTHTANQAS